MATAAGYVWKAEVIRHTIAGPIQGAYAAVTDGTSVHRVAGPAAASVMLGPVGMLGSLSKKTKANSVVALADGTTIDRFADQAPDGYATVREGVTVEVLPNEEGHQRAPSTDQEILERCDLMNQITGQPVTLITGDSGARINARSRGIEVFKLTDEDLLPRYKKPKATSDGVC